MFFIHMSHEGSVGFGGDGQASPNKEGNPTPQQPRRAAVVWVVLPQRQIVYLAPAPDGQVVRPSGTLCPGGRFFGPARAASSAHVFCYLSFNHGCWIVFVPCSINTLFFCFKRESHTYLKVQTWSLIFYRV